MSLIKIKAEEVFSKDLKPGDLFSSYGPDYWEDDLGRLNRQSLGERVYIRTEAPTPEDQAWDRVYKITIQA